MHLETPRLIFRSFTIDELHKFAAIQADPEVMKYIEGAQSLEVSEQQLLEIIREYGLSTLGITNMEAGGSIHNIASVKIMAQLGFANREELLFDGKPAVRFFD